MRNAAIEVRKRLAQYDLEPGHAAELRMKPPAGSCAPVFGPEVQELAIAEAEVASPWRCWAGLGCALLLGLGAAAFRGHRKPANEGQQKSGERERSVRSPYDRRILHDG